jgi:tetratricopeptide (TPR) repeat protein
MLKLSENKICKHSHVQQAFCMLKSLIYFTYLLGLLICFDSCSHSLQKDIFLSYEKELSDFHERKSKQTPVCEKNGFIYGKTRGIFGYQWFDYYERALSYREGECYGAALSDITHAIKLRSDEAGWAKTFGMHFIYYYPHREKGIILFLMGRYQNSSRALLQSLKQNSTDKANYYLDKVRKKLIGQRRQPVVDPLKAKKKNDDFQDEMGQPSETTQLTIQYNEKIIEQSDVILTNEDPVYILGLSQDNKYVTGIEINNIPLFMESSQKRFRFLYPLKLDEGKHTIMIKATNLVGGFKKKSINIIIDRSGPVIAINNYTPGREIRGQVYDRSGISFVQLNDKMILGNKKKDLRFHFYLKKNSQLLASDTLGNKTKLTFSNDLFANFPNHLVADKRNNVMTDSDKIGSITSRPVVKITNLNNNQVVYSDCIDIEGMVQSTSDIKQVEIFINDKKKIAIDAFNNINGHCTGPIIMFHKKIQLVKGLNQIVIIASDQNGKYNKFYLNIKYNISEIMKVNHRYCFKVYPVNNVDLLSNYSNIHHSYRFNHSHRIQFHNLFLLKLKKHNRFLALPEDSFSQSSFISNLLRMNKKTNPTYHSSIFIDSCVDKRGIELSARVVDKRSGIIKILDVYFDYKNKHLDALAERLSDKFHQAFPLFEGEIVKRSGQNFYFKIKSIHPDVPEQQAANSNIPLNWPIVVYQKNNMNLPWYCSNTEIFAFAKILGYTNYSEYKCRFVDLIKDVNKGEYVISK